MTNANKGPLDLAPLRVHLAKTQGRYFWKSLEELAGSEEFERFLSQEFPYFQELSQASLSRRDFMRLMGASLALAGLSACSLPPPEEILPYVRTPAEVVPGQSLFFASAMPLDGFANGVLVETRMGRPTKIEGNPRHPASLGGTDIFGQASVLQLWDPERARAVTCQGAESTWETLVDVLGDKVKAFEDNQGQGLYLLTQAITSPTLISQLHALQQRFPLASWHHYQPVGRDNGYEGACLAFGEPLETRYHLERATVLLSLDADFLGSPPGHLRYGRDFAKRRHFVPGQSTSNRLYVVEGTPSITGAMADHRLALRSGQIGALAWDLARELGVTLPERKEPLSISKHWINTLVEDLQQHGEKSLVVVGERQPPFVHALGHAINERLGNKGYTLSCTAPVIFSPLNQDQSLRRLVAAMAADKVDTLLMLGGNPAFCTPVDLGFSNLLAKVKLSVYLGLYADETAVLSDWHVPEAHYLESWGDARAYDGTVSLLQPLIAPLYQGKSAYELLGVLLNQVTSGYDIVRQYWQTQWLEADFENRWQQSLRAGFVTDTALPPKAVELKNDFCTLLARKYAQDADAAPGVEIIFLPDPTLWDGQFANNGWLQELPKPLTKLTWDNAALISPRTAEKWGLANEEVIELRYRNRSLQMPVWIVPGQAEEAITVTLGYGRKRAGQVGNGTGFNAYTLRTADAPWFDQGLEIVKTGKRYPLASAQHHHHMEGRDIVRTIPLAELGDHALAARQGNAPAESLYPAVEYSGYAWGMTIDQSLCTGCSACVLACQAENNIPVVGKDQVTLGREMHWLRIDRYYSGAVEAPHTYFQPVPCMHCENAPCELVCPTEATLHNSEGLNLQIYNRCIGTRFCSNNCPYKVRRFNFLHYAKDTPGLAAQRNPEVTVRMRGVMEKCTYCVQRISNARIQAELEDRRIQEGEVVTACQAACPTEAIVFGDLNDPASRVRQTKSSPLNYGLLSELNTRPRTTYLAKLTNPNPDLKEKE